MSYVVSNAYKKKKWRFLKDALWGGAGVPTGAGLVDQGPWFQGSGKGWLGGAKAQKKAGVGGSHRDGANFATCVVFLLFLTRTKRRKMAFFEGCPCGAGVPTGAGLVDGGVDQGPWFQARWG